MTRTSSTLLRSAHRFPSSVAEQGAVGVERRLPTEVGVEDVAALLDLARADEVDQAGHGLPLVHRVDDHALEATGEPDGLQRRLHGDAVELAGPALAHDDLVVAERPAEFDEFGRRPSDLGDLRLSCLELGGGVYADDLARMLLPGEAGDHAGLRRAGHAADDDRVEEDAEFALLLLDLVGPLGEAEATEPVVGRPGRDRVGHAAFVADVLDRLLPAAAKSDVEPGFDEADVGAHDARQQD